MTTFDDPSSPFHVDQLIPIDGRRVERIWTPSKHFLLNDTVNRLTSDCKSSKSEICGLISNERQGIFYVENIHEEPTHNFLMDREEYDIAIEEIFETRQTVLGIFHTHPNGVVWPSPRDIRGWPDPDLGWRYFIATPNEVIEWALV